MGISRPTKIPTTTTIKNNGILKEFDKLKLKKSIAELKPPTIPIKISISMNLSTRLLSSDLERKLPIPIANRYTPIINENWVTDSPSK